MKDVSLDVEGKRVIIERTGREFELPQGHKVEFQEVEVEKNRTETWVSLRTPMEGSTFHLAQLESRGADTVIVHLGGLIGAHGPPHVGEGLMSDRVGYPFPP